MDRKKAVRFIWLLALMLIFMTLFAFSLYEHEAIHRQIFGYFDCDSYTVGSHTFGNTTELNQSDMRAMMGLHSQLEIATYIIDMVMLLAFVSLALRYV